MRRMSLTLCRVALGSAVARPSAAARPATSRVPATAIAPSVRARTFVALGRPLGRALDRAGYPAGFPPVSYTHLTLPTICSV